MNITLVQLPSFIKGKLAWGSIFPIGLGMIAGNIQGNHKISINDFHAQRQTSIQNMTETTLMTFPDIIGITAMSIQYRTLRSYVKQLRLDGFNGKIIVGGSIAIHNHSLVMNTIPVDYCINGDGEVPINMILNGIIGQGIITKDNNYGSYRVPDLDKLNNPAYYLFDMKPYLETPLISGMHNVTSLPVLYNRGCPFSCNFCSRWCQGVRERSNELIIKEIEYLKEEYGIMGVSFITDTMMMNKPKLLDFCNKLKKLDVLWEAQGRSNFADIETFKVMKESGCVRVGFGIESGSQRILNNMHKLVSVDQNLYALKLAKKAGLKVQVQMIFGYPGEDIDSLRETVNFCKEARVRPTVEMSIITPLPGSKLYDDCLKSGIIRNEEQYLMNTDDMQSLNINLSNWDDEEFLVLKKKTEKQISMNYWRSLLKDPIGLKDLFLSKFDEAIRYQCKYGYNNLFKRVLRMEVEV